LPSSKRFIRSLKEEAFGERTRTVPLGAVAMQKALDAYLDWYTVHRPHQALGGRTPLEVWEGRRPAHRKPRLEPRARYPAQARAPCAAPKVAVRGRPGVKLRLVITGQPGAPHLPIVRIRAAA